MGVAHSFCYILLCTYIPLQDLIRELKSELSGHFEDVVIALMMKPTEYECHELRESVKVLLLEGISRASIINFLSHMQFGG